MHPFDLSSWHAIWTSLLWLILMSLIAVGIRLLMMQTLQRKQQRENRQINERLRTLIAAYKTLGGSFTGELDVDPLHLRHLQQAPAEAGTSDTPLWEDSEAAQRRRRIRDAVEAALSDIILLGTDEQVRLAAHAAREMVAGRKVHVAELVVSLRDFIRQALDLQAIGADVMIPHQGPLRPQSSGGGGRGTSRQAGQGGTAGKGAGGGDQAGGAAGGGVPIMVNPSRHSPPADDHQSS